jgi:hypothetical protein
MTTTLDPNFLVAVLQISGFKKEKMFPAQAALLHLALLGRDFTAADLPGEVTAGSRHLAGAACGALVAQGYLIAVDRIKSPDPKAKGRRLDVFRLAPGKRGTVITWLSRNSLPVPQSGDQMGLAI